LREALRGVAPPFGPEYVCQRSMTYFPDLTPYTYQAAGNDGEPLVNNVG
jgi:hypothetical protein